MKIIELFDLNPTEGEVGIEIEVEGRGIQETERPANWKMEGDGSLRGDAVEFILRGPINRSKVRGQCLRVKQAIKKSGAIVDYTGRAGVHVHLNVQQLTINQVYNLICAYMIFEDILTDFCGEDRVGNLFCLRVRDAEYLVEALRSCLREEDFDTFGDNDLRYASVNITSIPRYGSLEFRAMRSTVDHTLIDKWVQMLCALKDWAVGFDNPVQIIETFSAKGPDILFFEVFGPDTDLVYNEDAMFDGMRQAQYIAYTPYPWGTTLRDRFFAIEDDPDIEEWPDLALYRTTRNNFERRPDWRMTRALMHSYKRFKEQDRLDLDRRALRDAARDMGQDIEGDEDEVLERFQDEEPEPDEVVRNPRGPRFDADRHWVAGQQRDARLQQYAERHRRILERAALNVPVRNQRGRD